MAGQIWQTVSNLGLICELCKNRHASLSEVHGMFSSAILQYTCTYHEAFIHSLTMVFDTLCTRELVSGAISITVYNQCDDGHVVATPSTIIQKDQLQNKFSGSVPSYQSKMSVITFWDLIQHKELEPETGRVQKIHTMRNG